MRASTGKAVTNPWLSARAREATEQVRCRKNAEKLG
jgi:hypothetical protein